MNTSTVLHYETLEKLPDLRALYRKQLVTVVPGLGSKPAAMTDPAIGYELTDLSIDPDNLADYARATGLRLRNEIAPTYLFVLAFPVMIKIMDHKDYPLPAAGSVHLSNDITQIRPLRADETFDLRVNAENLRPHRKGLAVDFVTVVSVAGEDIARQVSTFLAQGVKFNDTTPHEVRIRPVDSCRALTAQALPLPGDAPVASLEQAPTAMAQFTFTPTGTKEYAAASKDENPLHVSKAGAKLFGFPTTIAHGMHSLAAVWSAMENVAPAAVRLRADFYKPLLLPGKAALYSRQIAGQEKGWDLQLRSAKDSQKLHVAARIEPAVRLR